MEEKVVGDVVNINHTEPVGYWHFAHSYVRGNWRKGAPSLLTKCCHDVDLLLWWAGGHQPAFVSSHGSLVAFRKRNKPVEAGGATNCLACPAERSCLYSAKRIYVEEQLRGRGELGWPNKVVAPEIEGEEMGRAEEILMGRLAEDYDIEDGGRSWYGRCVFEAGNEVVDNQVVVLEWEDGEEGAAKTATLTMVAHTERICERFTKVYGTRGEVTSDGRTVSVCDFKSGETRVYVPEVDEESGHGGGDAGLAGAFVDAVEAVLGGMSVEEAQRRFVGCEVEEAVRAHEVVFWAEDARLERRVLGWEEWRGRVDGS